MDVRHLSSRIEPHQGIPPPETPAKPGTRSRFAHELQRAREHIAPAPDQLRLSAHAQDRMEQRRIPLNDSQRKDLNDALQLLEQKGARDALLLRTDAAFLVNVASRTVVTAISQEELRQRVFTQIDSAVLI
jgi:flagellar operon protein